MSTILVAMSWPACQHSGHGIPISQQIGVMTRARIRCSVIASPAIFGSRSSIPFTRWTSATSAISMATMKNSMLRPWRVPTTSASIALEVSRGGRRPLAGGGPLAGTISRAMAMAAGALITEATRSWPAALGSTGARMPA